MSVSWDPGQYARYSSHRQRAAFDLLSRVYHKSPLLVHDIGCGRGEMARLMTDRWPDARVIGSDLSAEMIEAAGAEPSRVEWVELDITTWQPDAAYDVLYANAVFHWVADHDELLVRLIDALAPGGVLAFQMPLTWLEPINAVARELVDGRDELVARLPHALPPQEWYYDLLAPLATSLDIWETHYLQVLTGDDPVVEWAKGAALRPIVAGLEADELKRFWYEYSARMRRAYPQRPDGSTLLPFPRRFVVATV